MKKLLALLIVLFLAGLVMGLRSIIKEDTILSFSQKLALGMAGAMGALAFQAILRAAKKMQYGGWTVQITIDGVVAKEENESLSQENGEIMIEYDWPWWIVFASWGMIGTPHLRRNLASEILLRECCRSMGAVNGDIKNYAIVEKVPRVINLHLTEKQIFRYSDD